LNSGSDAGNARTAISPNQQKGQVAPRLVAVLLINRKKKGKQMKTLDAERIRDIAEEFTSKAMLAAMATLCIRFFMACMTASVRFYTMTEMTSFSCIYAQKRIVNRIVHHRKFALFPGYAKHNCSNENPNL